MTLRDFYLLNALGLPAKPWSVDVAVSVRGVTSHDPQKSFTFLRLLPKYLSVFLWVPLEPLTRAVERSDTSEMNQSCTLINASKGVLSIRSNFHSLFYFSCKLWPHHPT